MQRLISYLLLSMLILLPLSGQANAVRVMDTESVNSVPAATNDTDDCMMHQSMQQKTPATSAAAVPMAHADHTMDNSAAGNCCQDEGGNHCGLHSTQPGFQQGTQQGTSCTQSGCQCDHASTHLVTYLADTCTSLSVKVIADEIISQPVLTFAGYSTSLLRPPTHSL